MDKVISFFIYPALHGLEGYELGVLALDERFYNRKESCNAGEWKEKKTGMKLIDEKATERMRLLPMERLSDITDKLLLSTSNRYNHQEGKVSHLKVTTYLGYLVPTDGMGLRTGRASRLGDRRSPDTFVTVHRSGVDCFECRACFA